jgi:hypothetical protein
MELYYSSMPCLCEPESYLFSTDGPLIYEVVSARVFYNSRSDTYNESRDPTASLEAGQTLCYRAQRLGVVNSVFNDVGMTGLVACHPALGQWYNISSVELSCLIALLH